MIKRIVALLSWLINLFDPPPLQSMSVNQKTGRVFLLSATLVIGSVLVAMIGAVGLFLVEKGRELGDMPELLDGLGIIVIGVIVNAVCVLMLVEIKRTDHKLIPPEGNGSAVAKSQMQGKRLHPASRQAAEDEHPD
jgi:uncharacterized membrane protein YidH (DUF202 family)